MKLNQQLTEAELEDRRYRKFYEQEFQELDEEAERLTAEGWTLRPWNDLLESEKQDFRNMVYLYSEGEDYYSPGLVASPGYPHQTFFERPEPSRG